MTGYEQLAREVLNQSKAELSQGIAQRNGIFTHQEDINYTHLYVI